MKAKKKALKEERLFTFVKRIEQQQIEKEATPRKTRRK